MALRLVARVQWSSKSHTCWVGTFMAQANKSFSKCVRCVAMVRYGGDGQR